MPYRLQTQAIYSAIRNYDNKQSHYTSVLLSTAETLGDTSAYALLFNPNLSKVYNHHSWLLETLIYMYIEVKCI